MNIRQAIFASVASAGVLASGWLGGTPPDAQAAPATHRLEAATTGVSATTTTRPASTSSTLSSMRRQQLRGSEPVQLISAPGHTAVAYGAIGKAGLDGARA